MSEEDPLEREKDVLRRAFEDVLSRQSGWCPHDGMGPDECCQLLRGVRRCLAVGDAPTPWWAMISSFLLISFGIWCLVAVLVSTTAAVRGL